MLISWGVGWLVGLYINGYGEEIHVWIDKAFHQWYGVVCSTSYYYGGGSVGLI